MEYTEIAEISLRNLISILEALRILVCTIILWILYDLKACIPTAYFKKKSVDGDVVLVTGGANGVGRLLAVKMTKLNARVVIWDVDRGGLDETVRLAKLRRPQARIQAYVCDLNDREQIYETAEQVKQEVGDVDILINNAGIVTGKALMDCPDHQIVKTMNVNCLAHFWIVKAFLPRMKERNYGHIVTISSAAGIIALNNLIDYCSSKFAAVGFHEALSLELNAQGYHNIQTTLICPYYINTGMFDGVTTKFKWSLPIMDPGYATDKIMDAILINQKMLAIPKTLYLFIALKGLIPIEVITYLGHMMEATKSMDNFKGHSKKE